MYKFKIIRGMRWRPDSFRMTFSMSLLRVGVNQCLESLQYKVLGLRGNSRVEFKQTTRSER
jgi:hypothetical protein